MSGSLSNLSLQVTQYVDDPHIYHGLMKAKWAAASIEAINTSRQRVGEIELPVLVMHGAQDHLVPISASEFISSNIGSSDKTYRVQFIDVGIIKFSKSIFPLFFNSWTDMAESFPPRTLDPYTNQYVAQICVWVYSLFP